MQALDDSNLVGNIQRVVVRSQPHVCLLLAVGSETKEEVVLSLAYLSKQCHKMEIDQSVNSKKGLSTEVSGIGSGVVIMNIRGTWSSKADFAVDKINLPDRKTF